MADLAINAGIILLFVVWTNRTIAKLKEDVSMLIEENDKQTRIHIETKIQEFGTKFKAKKPVPGKEYYYEG